MNYLQKYCSNVPKYLFHYTSPIGLVGIANSQKLWATNSNYLNDNKELLHSVEIISERIHAVLYGHSPDFNLSDNEKKFFEFLLFQLRKNTYQTYVISLTTENDLLSQWRGYCANGGYSIGFPSQIIANALQKQHFKLSKCIYDDEIKIEVVKTLLLDYLSKYRGFVDSEKGEDYIYTELLNDFFANFSEISPYLKHKSFSEEQEWRLVSDARADFSLELKFRNNTKYVIPYLELDLKVDEHGFDSVLNSNPLIVIASPSDSMKIAANSAGKMFEKYWGKCKTEISSIPFRS